MHINELLVKLSWLRAADPRGIALCGHAHEQDYENSAKELRRILPPPRLPVHPLSGHAIRRRDDKDGGDELLIAYQALDGMRFMRFSQGRRVDALRQHKWFNTYVTDYMGGDRHSGVSNRVPLEQLCASDPAPGSLVSCQMVTHDDFMEAYRGAEPGESLLNQYHLDEAARTNTEWLETLAIGEGMTTWSEDRLPVAELRAIQSGVLTRVRVRGFSRLLTNKNSEIAPCSSLAVCWSPDFPWVRPQFRRLAQGLSESSHLRPVMWDLLGMCPGERKPFCPLFTDVCATTARIEDRPALLTGPNGRRELLKLLFSMNVSARKPLMALRAPLACSVGFVSEFKNKGLVGSIITANTDRMAGSLSQAWSLDEFSSAWAQGKHVEALMLTDDETEASLRKRLDLHVTLTGLAKGT